MSDKHYTHHSDQTHLELALRRVKQWFEVNATFLIYGLAAVLAVSAVIVWMRRQPDENAGLSALWMDARAPEDYQNIADQYVGTRLGNLARLKQADSLLNSATSKLFSDRDAANVELDEAEAALKRIADAPELDDTIRERVLLGLARVAEIRCDGSEASLQAAKDAWQAVLDHSSASIANDLAEERIAQLSQPEAASFYAWFHDADPKPADDLNLPGFPGGATGGPGTAVPAVPPNLNAPSFDLPSLEELGLDTPAESDDTESTDDDQSPAPEDTSTPAAVPAEDESPTDDSAGQDSQPADPPATDEPAPEKPAEGESAAEEPAGEEPVTEEPAEPAPDAGE